MGSMSLTKLLKAPIKLFKKDVISFLIIHRHDLGIINDKLHYIAVNPNASIFVLRQKVWYLLDLPDYCEEIIVLKVNGIEIPLTELRKGNDPQYPYVLEVWLPGHAVQCKTVLHSNMLTMGIEDCLTENLTCSNNSEGKIQDNLTNITKYADITHSAISNETRAINKTLPNVDNKRIPNLMQSDYRKSELSCRISNSSLFFKLHGRKSRDNFTNILLKIQSDLNTLSSKLSNLENRISL